MHPGAGQEVRVRESDLRSACDTVDTWLDDTAKASTGCTAGGPMRRPPPQP